MTDWIPADADAPPADSGPRELPHDDLAEQYTVGAMMHGPEVVDAVLAVLTPADLFHPKHEVVAETVIRLAMSQRPCDPIAVVDDLTERGELNRAGGVAYVHELHGVPTTVANADYYAGIVHEDAVRRRVIEAASRAVNVAYSKETPVVTVVEAVRREIDSVETGRRQQVRMIGSDFTGLIDELEHEPRFLPTPWESVDKIIGGYAPGSLYVIAARPGSGKTIAVLQSAVSMARKGVVAFSSIEMTEDQLQRRLIAQFGPLHLGKLRSHHMSKEDWETFANARARVAGAPIAVDYTPSVTITDIRSHARAVARQGNLVGVVVDYLQLVKGEGQDRRVVVDNVAQALKELAKELDVPVIAAAQLNRGEVSRGKKRPLPTLRDLREGGGIENAADVVLLLHRGEQEEARDLKVIAEKNRHGNQAQVTLRWEAEYGRVVDRRWSPTAMLDEREVS